MVLPNEPRSRTSSWAHILNWQFPYRDGRRLADEKERGARRCQINTGGEISTSCTPGARQAEAEGSPKKAPKRLPKGRLSKKEGPEANPKQTRMSFSLSGLPPLPKSLSGLLNIAGSHFTYIHSIHFRTSVPGFWFQSEQIILFVIVAILMKDSLFIVICVQAILPFNLRAHSLPLVPPFHAQRPPSHPLPSTQMSLPTPPPWLQEPGPETVSVLHMTLKTSGMDAELRQCRATEI